MARDSLSPEAEQIMAIARQESKNQKHLYLGVEHVFIALTKVEQGLTQRILRKLVLDPKHVRDDIRHFVGSSDGIRYWDGIRITPRCETALSMVLPAELFAVKSAGVNRASTSLEMEMPALSRGQESGFGWTTGRCSVK